MLSAGQGRHLLVTGASNGIGRAVARLAVQQGWRVSGIGRDRQRLAALAQELGPAFLPLIAEVGEEAALCQVVQTALAAHGPFQAVVACAGIGVYGPLLEIPADQLRRVLDIDLVGVHRTLLASRPGWAPQVRLVLVSSICGLVPIPFMGAYCAAKHALEAYAGSLRLELAPTGVRVCTVCPGTVDTGFRAAAATFGRQWQVRPGQPLTAQQVARVILRVATSGSSPRIVLPWGARVVATLWRLVPGTMAWLLARIGKG